MKTIENQQQTTLIKWKSYNALFKSCKGFVVRFKTFED